MRIIKCIFKAYGKTVGIPGENGTETARGFFTLNALNYDAAHNYLTPRAVAYSAGLVNPSSVAI